MDCLRDNFVEGVLLNGRYLTISPLNHGSFGMVFMAEDLLFRKQVALKCLTKATAPRDKNSSMMVDDKSEELMIHTRIGHHPYIVNLIDSFETETHSYLVLEYCPQGDLYEAIRNDKGPKETEHVRSFMLELVSAVEHLHLKGIYHRDIKPENIFLTDSGNMKLGDFGLATLDAWCFETAVGSDRYMAPEQFDHQGGGMSPARADVWSIGICLLNILFSRNPFAEPAQSDLIFADFVRDRQSLFDVFPNMSMDTFEVITHCLAIDPEKRSLSALRDALMQVCSFTTDDESIDDFCADTRDVVAATVGRQPLRTPSIASPPLEQGEAFPWSKALQMTSPQKRQLSAIHDNDSEDLFPSSRNSMQDWYSKADSQSINSTVDSGLGLSLGSSEFDNAQSPTARSRPMLIAGSLPSRGRSALSTLFGKKKQFESKSWSDMWEEEEEERAEMEREKLQDLKPARPARPSRVSTLSQIDSESDGRSTPRAGLSELNMPSLNARRKSFDSTNSQDDGISEHTGFVFEDHPATPKYSPPSKRSIIDKGIDKWSALGDKRRGANVPARDSTPTLESKKREFFRPSNWRRNTAESKRPTTALPATPSALSRTVPHHQIWQQKSWNLSTDWRSTHNLPSQVSNTPKRKTSALQLDGRDDSISDDEWVGGWKDLHL
ncbi:hypothetical protein FH972_023691 [Carpinus fangiana]|uniref:Protein kinase domain-containing protein n=1 Tax=Carpinus fangiana TaxID=176857 RepID=A0A5N6KWP9_9ROSI|nr:hypothetical protein FH972_023691 [Carpinus fangiana]